MKPKEIREAGGTLGREKLAMRALEIAKERDLLIRVVAIID